MELTIVSKSARQTKRIAGFLAREVGAAPSDYARVIALSGNLGAGKTTFIQGFAQALGVKGSVRSPTFVLMKFYSIISKFQVPSSKFQTLIHIDCYRLDRPDDLLKLGFQNFLKNKRAIIVIEWAERIRALLPQGVFWVGCSHGKEKNERIVKFKAQSSKLKTTA